MLFPYQRIAIDRLKESNGCQLLHIGCGGGKTLTTLTYLEEIKAKKVLIVAPATLLSVWEDEARKWFNKSVIKIKGKPVYRKKIYDTFIDGYAVISYELFLKDFKLIEKLSFDVLVAEESHRIKNPQAKVTKAVLKLAKKVPKRIALTGTAMPGGWKDIWAQVQFVCPGALYENFYMFRAIHCIMPIPNVPMVKGYRDVEGIKNKIKPHMLTVPKEVIDSELPPITTQDIAIDLSSEERKHYKQLKDDLILQISADEQMSVANALVLIGRLRQAVNGLFVFGMDVPSSKLASLEDLVSSVSEDEKIIIFTMYAESAKKIAEKLNTAYIVMGETKEKDQVIADWKANGRILVGTKSLSEGWNLQEARYCINYDLPYTNSELIQRISRIMRTGQKRPVHVYNLIVNDSIDAHVKQLLASKKGMTDELVAWTRTDIDNLLL